MLAQYELSGNLITLSSLHVGSGVEEAVIDQPLMRDGRNRLVIPGTSLAGVLRVALGREITTESAKTSPITLCDSVAPRETRVEVVTHNSIDRNTGATAEHHLHSMEMIPAGTSFTFRALTKVHNPEEEPEILQELETIAQMLSSGDLAVGKGASSGHGRVQLLQATVKETSFTAQGLRALLRNEVAQKKLDRSAPQFKSHRHMLKFEVNFEAEGALFSGVRQQKLVADIVPLTQSVPGNPHKIQFVIPGSSVKGVFRQRAELIARTLTGTPVADHFLHQLSQTGLRAVQYLFGAGPETQTQQSGHRGVLTFYDLESKANLDRDLYATITSGLKDCDQSQLARSLKEATEQLRSSSGNKSRAIRLDLITRTAIDRFSGNVMDGALFTTLEPYVNWKPMRIDLDVDFLRKLCRMDENSFNGTQEQCAFGATIALLLLLLVDLKDGLLRFGADTTSGSGGVIVNEDDIVCEEILKSDMCLGELLGVENPQRLQSTLKGLLQPEPDSPENNMLDELTSFWELYLLEEEERNS
ncbi:RAMP superfamily CRISPR-associated protein [Corynebacterium sp. ES2794-CONJ1]|uniref:RAMP superfamily CRISPR-associated protein n=1 Tax=Corynebacterium sp. ES2794-CONJ1 TaxID=2980553 RepID=UPI0021D843BD|nr:RAMP superfamily CRISPR-associated protein [Corynebacterium sp. ES2794-CONJ1]MCU9518926.1 RAMP superfamily CRISPR-associated protein [Corynebacterium sp. ES2794-CONJ1]